MINLFETGQDLYVHIGKIAFPDLDWTTKAVKKAKRPIFKQVLLGSLYGNSICRSKITLIAGNSQFN